MDIGIDLDNPELVKTLLSRMDASPGFASLGTAVKNVVKLVDHDGDNRQIVASIMRDPVLTAKLIRIANSSRYPRGAGNVSTIDQVLALLGLNTVKSVALSLALLNSLSNKPQSRQLHAEVAASFFAGALAASVTRQLGPGYGTQEAQISGFMQNLGRSMSLFYLYEEIEKSRHLQIEKNLSEEEAIERTLGTGYDNIGMAIAKHWGLPESLQHALQPDTLKTPPAQPASDAKTWQLMCALFCRRMTAVLFRQPESQEKVEMPKCVDFFQKALNLNSKDVAETIQMCLEESSQILAEMEFPGGVDDAQKLLRKTSERSIDMLSGADSLVQKEKNTGTTPIERLKHLMRLLHSHCNFDCTLICLPAGNGLAAIAGVGRNAGQLTSRFRGAGGKGDVIQLIMERKSPVFVPDVAQPNYANVVPAWYNQVVGAKSFVMLPLTDGGRLLGVVYGDYAKPQAAPPSELGDAKVSEWRQQLIQILKAGPKSGG